MSIVKHESQYAAPVDPRFDQTDFVVIGPHDLIHIGVDIKWQMILGARPWESEPRGVCRHFATIDGRAVWANVSWAVIGGKRVAFVDEGPNDLFQGAMLEEWCLSAFKCLGPAHEHERTWRLCGVGNFIHVIQQISALGGEIRYRGWDAAMKALEAVPLTEGR